MYEEYESRGLSVLGFPCNQFGGQEPGTNEEIKAHVEEKYGITFDMMSKIDVNGPDEHPLYTWLKGKAVFQFSISYFEVDIISSDAPGR